MQINEIIQLVDTVSKSNVQQLIYKTGNESLSINKVAMAEQSEKMVAGATPVCHDAVPDTAVRQEHIPPAEPAQPVKAPAEKTPEPAKQDDHLVDVSAPFVGTVMFNDSKTGDRFVELGDKVTKGQLLFVMESMKLFTDVTAPANGKVAQICVNNNQTVEFGTVILKIDEGS